MAVTVMAATVNGQKYFLTMALACSWNRHSKNPTNANRAVRKMADIPKKTNAGKPIKPAQMAINLYGMGVTAVKNMINRPCRTNISWARANFSMLAKF